MARARVAGSEEGVERLEELGRYLVVALDGVGAAGKGTGGEQ